MTKYVRSYAFMKYNNITYLLFLIIACKINKIAKTSNQLFTVIVNVVMNGRHKFKMCTAIAYLKIAYSRQVTACQQCVDIGHARPFTRVNDVLTPAIGARILMSTTY